MKKILIALVVAILLIVVVATVFVGKLDGIIADAIQTEGSAAIGTAVTVDKVETKLADGIAIISGLAIANPPGYQAQHAVRINTFTAEVDYQSQLIEDILINKAVFNAELIGTKSNFQDLLDGIPNAETVENSAEDELELTIRSLTLKQATVNVNSDQLGQTSFVMDDLLMTNISGTADQLSEQISNRLINHVTSQVKEFATAQITKLAKDLAVEKAKELVSEQIDEQVSEKLKDKLGDKLKGLKLKFK